MPALRAVIFTSTAALATLFGAACPEVPSSARDDLETRVFSPPDGDIDARPLEVTVATPTFDAEVDAHDVDGSEAGPTCAPAACVDDGNPCTDAACDAAGRCVHLPNLRPCDDGSTCSVDDRCNAGVCVGRALDCDDREACTLDQCEEGRGCRHDPTEGPCDDADACTDGDVCTDGACVGTTRICPVPPGSFGCAVATCDVRTGCGLRERGGTCDDEDACTSNEMCVAGSCVGQLVACDDEDPCTDDYCDPTAGCTRIDNHAPCDDGDPCTLGDRCAGGACVGGAASGCCDAETGLGCEDDDPCTSERCEAGRCVVSPTCADDNVCTIDVCTGGVCTFDASPVVPESGVPGLVLAGFEGALGADWRFVSDNPEVGWQRDAHWSASGSWSLYVGKVPDYSYDYGKTRAAAEWTVMLPVDAGALAMTVRSAVAETSCSYDAVTLEVDGVPLMPPVCGGADGEKSWDVARFAGRWVTITFVFDTVDDESNGGLGVWLDDVTTHRTGPATCCSAGLACP